MQPPKPTPFGKKRRKPLNQEAATKIMGKMSNDDDTIPPRGGRGSEGGGVAPQPPRGGRGKNVPRQLPSIQDTKRKVLSPVVKAVTGGRLEEDGSISGKRKRK